MRKLYIILVTSFFVFGSVQAQNNESEEIKLFRSLFGQGKKVLVAEFIQPQGESEVKFWEVYDEYEMKRSELGNARLSLLKDYVENYESMTDDKMEELLKKAQAHHKKFGSLLTKYQKKMKKVAGLKASTQFYQLENYFESGIRMAIMESIPFIGELDN